MRIRVQGLILILLSFLACQSQVKDKPPQNNSPLVIFLNGTPPTNLDPQIPFDESDYVLGNIYEQLISFDASFRLSPGLAQRWTNPDDRTWRFYLDPAAKFSDGSPLLASDVKFSIERLQKLSGSDRVGFTENIETVRVVDDHTVDIVTNAPFIVLNNLVYIPILSEKNVTKVKNPPFIGTGPYRFQTIREGESITLERNIYHAPPPAIPEVRFIVKNAQEHVLEDLQKLKPDVTLGIPFRKIVEFLAMKKENRIQGMDIESAKGIAVYYMVFNLRPRTEDFPDKNPLTDIRLRKALALGVERNELVEKVVKGLGRPATQMVAPEIFGYDPSTSYPAYNPEEARKLIQSAGYSGLKFHVYGSESGSNMMEKTLIEQWTKIGVQPDLVRLPDAEINRRLVDGSNAISVSGYSCGSGDASEFLTFSLHSRDAQMRYGKGNYANYSNPEVDRICTENLKVFDPRERLQMLQNSLHIVMQDVPYLPLIIPNDVYIVSDRLQWQPAINGELVCANMSYK